MVVMARGQGYKVVHKNESTKGTKCLVRERVANEGELDVYLFVLCLNFLGFESFDFYFRN